MGFSLSLKSANADDALAFARSFRGGIALVFDAVDVMAFPLRLVAERRLPDHGAR